MVVRRWLLRALVAGGTLLGAAFGCTSNHDVLKQKPHGTGGSVATGGSAGAGLADADLDAPPDVFVEPTGKDRLTLVHGVVDADHIAFCFAKVDAGVPGDPIGVPLPTGGLLFGGALAVDQLSGIDLGKDDVEPIVIAGDFSLLAGKSCSDAVALAKSFEPSEPDASDSDASDDASLDAGDESDVADVAVELPPPPPLRALALPVMPAGTFSGGYSALLVAAGCIGGPAFADSLQEIICGPGYAPDHPTLAPMVARLSRATEPSHLGLQAGNASLASDILSFQSSPAETSALPGFAFAFSVGFGALAPKPPELSYSKALIGPLAESSIEIVPSGSTVPAFSATWQAAMGATGLAELSDGKNYAVIYVGPQASVPSGNGWWNAPKLLVIPNDPQS